MIRWWVCDDVRFRAHVNKTGDAANVSRGLFPEVKIGRWTANKIKREIRLLLRKQDGDGGLPFTDAPRNAKM